MSAGVPSVLAVRRSIHVKAAPARVWQELADFERMNRWWGVTHGSPEAGSGNGQWLRVYEPRIGGRIEMELLFSGAPLRYGGPIVVFQPPQELTFESDWIPNQGWQRPTQITIRLGPALGGTLVELFHHGFERTGPRYSEEYAAYEAGWGMTQLNELKAIVERGP